MAENVNFKYLLLFALMQILYKICLKKEILGVMLANGKLGELQALILVHKCWKGLEQTKAPSTISTFKRIRKICSIFTCPRPTPSLSSGSPSPWSLPWARGREQRRLNCKLSCGAALTCLQDIWSNEARWVSLFQLMNNSVWESRRHCSFKHNELIINFKPNKVIRDQEGHYILMKDSIP